MTRQDRENRALYRALPVETRAKVDAAAVLVSHMAREAIQPCGTYTAGDHSDELAGAIARYFSRCREAAEVETATGEPTVQPTRVEPDSVEFWKGLYTDAEADLAQVKARETQLANGLHAAIDLLDEAHHLKPFTGKAKRLRERVWTCYSGETADGEDAPIFQTGPMLRSLGTLVEEASENQGAAVVTFHAQSDDPTRKPDPSIVVVAAVGEECRLLSHFLWLTESQRSIQVREELL